MNPEERSLFPVTTLALLLALALTGAVRADVWLLIVTTPAPTVQWAHVERVVDGDTLIVNLECCRCLEDIRVRLLAVDTPERGECYYAKATAG